MEKNSRIFITGATGFIGEKLALDLAAQGHTVHALVRDPNKTPSLKSDGITMFQGDINNRNELDQAITTCKINANQIEPDNQVK